MATQARERLLAAAEALFYDEGINAVGVDRLVKESGVGRASFYRHFASKDALVVAVLESRDRQWRTTLADAMTARGNQPIAIFDVLTERYAAEDFRGCAFINAMVEMADRHSEAHRVARGHKRALIEYMTMLLGDAGYRDCWPLAENLLLLIDGAVVGALREGHPGPVETARGIAALLLAQSSPGYR